MCIASSDCVCVLTAHCHASPSSSIIDILKYSNLITNDHARTHVIFGRGARYSSFSRPISPRPSQSANLPYSNCYTTVQYCGVASAGPFPLSNTKPNQIYRYLIHVTENRKLFNLVQCYLDVQCTAASGHVPQHIAAQGGGPAMRMPPAKQTPHYEYVTNKPPPSAILYLTRVCTVQYSTVRNTVAHQMSVHNSEFAHRTEHLFQFMPYAAPYTTVQGTSNPK